MKKLMIALAAVACAAGVRAASVSWQSNNAGGTAATYLVDATDKTTKLSAVPDGGSIVLIKLLATDIASFSAGTWSGAKDDYTVLNTAAIGSGKGIGKATGTLYFEYGTQSFHDGDYLAAVLKTADGAFTQLTYTDDSKVVNYMTVEGMAAAEEKGEESKWSQNFNYATAGNFYAAVPEPTSGLLLLLGVAGLALRRRRA